MSRDLAASFFARPTPEVARLLLGKVLVSAVGDAVVAGTIVETEAYLGVDDPGSHAATKGITARNRVMYGPPGRAYVYFTYGNHHMLNLVTEAEGTAGAVLVRAVEPVEGVEVMTARRHGRAGHELTNGPGKVAEAFGVTLAHNGLPLGRELRVLDAPPVADTAVGTSGRVGLASGHELPLRFYIAGNGYVSKGRTGPKPPKRRKESA
ncbi:MAG: DNA-3-methyladenine glycosylase [Actinobacteria bacterium]|nr:DNA-3-methyladenine glycosylase [Actinomycetota bacterium]